jgi:hypothetical protein
MKIPLHHGIHMWMSEVTPFITYELGEDLDVTQIYRRTGLSTLNRDFACTSFKMYIRRQIDSSIQGAQLLTAGWCSGLRSRLRNLRSRVQIPVMSRGFCDEPLDLLTSYGYIPIIYYYQYNIYMYVYVCLSIIYS